MLIINIEETGSVTRVWVAGAGDEDDARKAAREALMTDVPAEVVYWSEGQTYEVIFETVEL